MPEQVVRLGVRDAGELYTLQLAAWLREGRENGTFDIPPLLEELSDVVEQLQDPRLTIWGYRNGRGEDRDGHRLLGTVRTSPLPDNGAMLGRLGVVPDLFRQGLGGQLLAWAEDRLPPSVTRIELFTGLHSVSNHRFYERHGYRLLERDEAVGVVRLVKYRRPA